MLAFYTMFQQKKRAKILTNHNLLLETTKRHFKNIYTRKEIGNHATRVSCLPEKPDTQVESRYSIKNSLLTQSFQC